MSSPDITVVPGIAAVIPYNYLLPEDELSKNVDIGS